MRMNRVWRFVPLICVFVLGMALYTAHAQQAAPTETKGISQKLLAAVDLGPEIDGMAGRQLRVRQVTLAPGAVFAVHNHKDRPGVAYVLQGTITEHRGDAVKDYHAGEVWTETKDTTHWIENRGTTDAILLPSDVFHTQP